MTAQERDLTVMMTNALHSLAAVQLECSSQGNLIADMLPGLTADQRKELKFKSQIHATHSAKIKDQAEALDACINSNV
ncbi:hypothetical protein [Luteolibacter sp. Populi]|uniref:hypothetical protein n=1 Tax=Luteolibacter sp. Populi TaxID=3230487 RepID=UPI0034666726